MIIRPARPEDTNSLAKLYQSVRQQIFTWEPPEKFKISDYRESVAGEEVWVAEIKNTQEMLEIAGFISVWAKTSFIHNLFVAPPWQQHGIGTKLLKKALECYPQPLTLKVHIANAHACHYYEKLGWRRISTDEQAVEPYHLYEYSRGEI
jgi:GNAT superfamily N-acetyltransferase